MPRADWPAVLGAARQLLAPDGWLRIECGGGDNVAGTAAAARRHLRRVRRSPWRRGTSSPPAAPSTSSRRPASRLGGEDWVRTVAQRRAFDREGVLGWLRSQCENAYLIGLPVEQHEAFRAAVTERVDELRRADGTYDVTFVRLDLLVSAVVIANRIDKSVPMLAPWFAMTAHHGLLLLT